MNAFNLNHCNNDPTTRVNGKNYDNIYSDSSEKEVDSNIKIDGVDRDMKSSISAGENNKSTTRNRGEGVSTDSMSRVMGRVKNDINDGESKVSCMKNRHHLSPLLSLMMLDSKHLSHDKMQNVGINKCSYINKLPFVDDNIFKYKMIWLIK